MSGDFSQVKESLVDKILEQGQKLRNAMVQSILQNDPLSSDIISKDKICNAPALSNSQKKDKKLLEAFLSGDYLTKAEEEAALNTIRSMPSSNVYETTARAAKFSKCSCATCLAYHESNLNVSHKERQYSLKFRDSNSAQILKQVDSLKVILQSIHLNKLGNKKVGQGLNNYRSKNGYLNETYFVEYCIPEVFISGCAKSKSKIDSGLKNDNSRVCARRTSNIINIRQTFIHSIQNFYDCNLDDHDLVFFVRYKNSVQSKAEQLGVARFNFGIFRNAKNVSCGKSVPIYLEESSAISVGLLKVTVQLGAGKLYFGQEFLDAVLFGKTPLDSDSSGEGDCKEKFDKNSKRTTGKATQTEICKSETLPVKKIETLKLENKKRLIESPVQELKEEILFGFLYIPEAHFFNIVSDSYILCRPYCQNNVATSTLVHSSLNPIYNFCQLVPLIYEDSLLQNLRENFTVLEFWTKQQQTEELFGLSRIPLNQFYLGFRNSTILSHLKRNKLPIIGTDWWEPIYSPDNSELIGQVQVLSALGTEDQIKRLKEERGFKEVAVKAKITPIIKPNPKKSLYSTYLADKTKINRKPLIGPNPLSEKLKKDLSAPKKSDVGIQSEMDIPKNAPSSSQTQEMLVTFLKVLEQNQKPPCVENGTNTEAALPTESDANLPKTEMQQAEPQLRKTSDLLDSLQRVLNEPPKEVLPPHFMAEIFIKEANQLPSRCKVKSKSKRAKGKAQKRDENILPSAYVTFETLPGCPLQVTSICPKTTSPKWGFRCRARLPLDLVTNAQKRLIFKVWKKSTSVVLQPNYQTDLVLGFAALDLSVLSCGLPTIEGWFNIVDFSGKCNGQINIGINPLDNLTQNITKEQSVPLLDLAENEECNELLSRTLKRKFTELDEITQRLRLRLSEVVSDEFEDYNDNIADEFEQDINSLCVEDDFDMVNFERDTKTEEEKGNMDNSEINKLKASYSSGLLTEKQESADASGSNTSILTEQLTKGKQHIDNLLQKLTLITSEQSLSSRYVSGCSTNEDIQNVFDDLDQHSRPNITATNSLDPVAYQQLYDNLSKGNSDIASSNGEPSNGSTCDSFIENDVSLNGSETSVISCFSDCRPKPDGQGE